MKKYTDSVDTYGAAADADLLAEARKTSTRCKVTEIEGLLVYILNTTSVDDKIEIRNKCSIQNEKLKKIPGSAELLHPRLQQRIADALIFL